MRHLHPGRPWRGFTLIEMMFVVAILGILMAVVIPRMGGSADRMAVETTGRNIARLSEYARQMAISQQQETTITFDREEGRWWLALPFDPEDRSSRRILNRGRREEHVALSEEEEINKLHPRLQFRDILVDGRQARDAQTVVSYYPNGTSSGAQVIIVNSKNKTLTIEIESSTGRASAYAGEPKDFAAKLEEAGIDPGKFGLTSSTSAAVESKEGGRFYRIGSTEERVNYYSDVAEKIMNRTRTDFERQNAASQDPNQAPPVSGNNPVRR